MLKQNDRIMVEPYKIDFYNDNSIKRNDIYKVYYVFENGKMVHCLNKNTGIEYSFNTEDVFKIDYHPNGCQD